MLLWPSGGSQGSTWQSAGGSAVVWSDTPDDITHVIGNQQRAVPIHRDADGPAHGFARSIDEAAQHVFRLPGRLAIAKGNEHHLVAATGPAVP